MASQVQWEVLHIEINSLYANKGFIWVLFLLNSCSSGKSKSKELHRGKLNHLRCIDGIHSLSFKLFHQLTKDLCTRILNSMQRAA